ncbi:hypothetical protein GDO86_012093 [Hymenochirus boettgeri]|uniref:Taste receptor type 2 n=1 Tax=Hymenochirus boettgeri TaxID=247094 RepID=A0A8T2IQV2_9PIPI|nr:hypothetical protein GDO86_017633 [Hymenochirus boettgeri]KAG8443553.1 hypothetical protein GDO86_012093 [Hymenochirus boettgeri]
MGWDIITLPTILIVDYISGLVSNVFILSVHFHCWLKGETLSSSDLIIVGLAFSSIIYSLVKCSTCIILFYSPGMSSLRPIIYTLCFTSIYSFYSSTWLGTCLCFFFYVKIINFQSRFFSWLKMKIDTLVPWMIFAAEVFSVFNSLLYIFTYLDVNPVNSTDPFFSSQISSCRTTYSFNPSFQIINTFIPILIATVTTSHIIVSLYKHIHRMRQNIGDGDGPSLKVHKRAAFTMFHLLVFYITVYGITVGFVTPQGGVLGWILYILSSLYAFVQSIILILGNNRLLQTCVKILNRLRPKILP